MSTVHLFDVAPLRPPFGGEVPTQALVIVDDERVTVVDAGFPAAVFADPSMIGFEARFLRLPDRPDSALVNRLASIGVGPDQVGDIVLTHLHSEHAAGVCDFPEATVHVSATELAVATGSSLRARVSYRTRFFDHGPRWSPHDGDLDWLGVPGCTEVLDGIVLVPLPGHTAGHCGVAVRLDDGTWLLHTGDASYADPRSGTPAAFPLGFYERFTAADRAAQRHTLATLARLAARDDVHLMSSHRIPMRLPLTLRPPVKEHDR
ncbi:MBL fold metallo-hydrolase [Gordonia spumicola]|uniref:MBL fold metallo-hydrolase n=1 Tax=Gordonia spumicola TaxID=589161 RepID=A0A7I9V4H6_9ACTN|nr:MBL fold metallo-hydrolase [Gordonia spumicola]GEE00082.1 MBL fold metallo-hydrolase [Gordonia spumicola]